MLKPSLFLFLLFALLQAFITNAQPQETPSNSTITAQFKQLNQGISVLYIAAHPDDENTQLLTYLTKVKHFRTGYLSLTRGDGGQNLIGAEQGLALGIVRTHELAEARKIDGAEQFFTRAYDFGFSKSPEETFLQWNKEQILADVVYVIRKFKPDVIITRFDSDGSGGHGQHTASAMLAFEAFKLAADSSKFPEQFNTVGVHQTKRIFYNSIANWLPGKLDTTHLLSLEIGNYLPELGFNTGEIAASSRSMHLSQGFGSEKKRGKQIEYFKSIAGDTSRLNGSLFNQITPTIELLDPSLQSKQIVEKAYHCWVKGEIRQCTEKLFEARNRFIQIGVKGNDACLQQIEQLILAVNGIYAEAVYKQVELPTAGDSIHIHFEMNARNSNAFLLKSIQIGNQIQNIQIHQALVENNTYNYSKNYWIEDSIHSNIFWIDKGIQHNCYQISQTQVGNAAGLTFSIPVQWNLLFGKDSIQIKQQVLQKEVLPQAPENYRKLVFNPPLLLSLPKKLIIAPIGKICTIELGLQANNNFQELTLDIQLPKAWKLISQPNTINLSKNEFKKITLQVEAGAMAETGNLFVKANCAGKLFSLQQETIEYPHIGKHAYFQPAQVKIFPSTIQPSSKRILYVSGSKEQVPGILKELGYTIDMIQAKQFSSVDLLPYQVLIFGIRSFNIHPELFNYRNKYLSFIEKGGNVLVCYQTNTFTKPFEELIGPYPFRVSKERTTNENALVSFDENKVQLLQKPFVITSSDFENWVQERGIYYASNIDTAYNCPLQIADFNEPSQKGALIQCQFGKGNFTYTGLSFFRQVPAGVQGAIKLLVNLIEQ